MAPNRNKNKTETGTPSAFSAKHQQADNRKNFFLPRDSASATKTSKASDSNNSTIPMTGKPLPVSSAVATLHGKNAEVLTATMAAAVLLAEKTITTVKQTHDQQNNNKKINTQRLN